MSTKIKNKSNKESDLPDSPKDEQQMKNEETTIDMPDVKDIPGQEHIHVPRMKEFGDVTISSDDEEGKGIWDEDNEVNDDSDVSDTEKKVLEDSANDTLTHDEESLRKAELDSTDNEGEVLNEKTSANAISGSDLDVPGSEDDNEEIGREDEENNPYSLGGDDQSINEERSGT